MQCTCPLSDNAHNNNNNSDLLNRRHHDHHLEQYQSQKQLNNKANAVQWHSSQTLPNPKRRRYNNTNNTRDSTSCSCNSAACVFSSHNNNNSTSRRNVIDPRSGNPVKSCLNLSSTTAASRGPCYLCSRSQSLPRPRIQHDQQRQHRRSNKQNQENLPLGPYLVSNPQLVTPHHHPQPNEHNNNCGYNCSRLRYSSNNSVNNNYPRVPPSAECVAQ